MSKETVLKLADEVENGFDIRVLTDVRLLSQMEASGNVSVSVNVDESEVHISAGDKRDIKTLARLIRSMAKLYSDNPDIDLVELMSRAGAEEEVYTGGFSHIQAGKRTIVARTPNQSLYIDAIKDNDITFGIGPPGTGKTYIACAAAVAALQANEVSKIILSRPPVDAGEKIGFLPGTIEDKLAPYLAPVIEEMESMLGVEVFEGLVENKTIEIGDISKFRGRNLKNAFCVFDEMQNATEPLLKLAMTRLSEGSKMVITGDLEQIDIKDRSGLEFWYEAINTVGYTPEGITMTEFDAGDVKRHPVVQNLVKFFNEYREITGNGS